MNEMSSRWLWASPVRGRYRLGALALALLAVACGLTSGPSSSSSSHWLVCQEDTDCLSLGQAARCDDGGYCANSDGRISLPIEDGAGGGGGAASGGAGGGGGGGAEPNPASGGTNGEGGTSCTGAACSACPAPRIRTDVICESMTYWARDPASACCPYENACVAPEAWPLFSSEEECQTDCRCAVVEPTDVSNQEAPFFGVERISLECRCADGSCPENVQAATAEWCESADNFGYDVIRYQGCGMIAFASDGGFTGGQLVFDEGTGALVGTSSYSDTTSLPCLTFTTIAGREFECSAAVMCQLCGPPGGVPPCD